MGTLLVAALLGAPLSAGAAAPPVSCLTPWIAEQLHGRTTSRPTDRLRSPAGDEWFSYVSPAGLFEMHYTTTGIDAVRPRDEDPANGIPDLVEDCAVWLDAAWAAEVDALAYPAPPLPADGTYDATFQYFAGDILGACGPQEEEGPDHTEIFLRKRFGGFGVDPDLLAQSTIAHELKHAIQYLVNHWGEMGWVELDANWVVDHVFDEAEYGRVLQYEGSQLSSPEQSLDHGGTGSYLDFLWEEYLWQKHGGQILHDFWDIRAAQPAQDVLDSYRDAQLAYGADWSSSYPEFMEWCWFSGSRADPSFGFPEADLWIEAALREAPVTGYPHEATDALAHLACHHRRFDPGNPSRRPRVLFDGEPGAPVTVSVISGFPGGGFSIERPAPDGNGDFDWLAPDGWSELQYLAVTVTNAEPAGTDRPYSLQVTEEAVTGVVVAAAPPSLRAWPNPFSESVELGFGAAAQTPVSLTIHDVRGRLVRRLAPGARRWDGRGQDGRPVPAGVYWVRLEAGSRVTSLPVTRIR